MPNKRAKGQTLIAAALEEDMLEVMDKLRGGKSRSLYLREAIAEKLKSQGYDIPDLWIHGHDRAGKPHTKKRVTKIQKIKGNVEYVEKKNSTYTSTARGGPHVDKSFLLNEDEPEPKKGKKK